MSTIYTQLSREEINYIIAKAKKEAARRGIPDGALNLDIQRMPQTGNRVVLSGRASYLRRAASRARPFMPLPAEGR